MDKRSSSRVLFKADATVSCADWSVDGVIENLSLKGMFFLTETIVSADTPVEINIRLDGDTERKVLELQGLIVRADAAGWGILFTSMGLEAFGHLRNVVIYNSGRDEGIMEEFRKLLATGLEC